MGAVYLALDPELKRQVALKVLPKDKAANPTLVKRFKAEATSAAALRHENIVSIYDRGEADGLHYIALEYVDGTDVHNLIEKRGVLPVKRSLEIIKQIARALEHAHSLGIVHRDIKPANLLIRRDGVVKLTDMGLARALDEATDTSITRPGTTVGTVDYMAPEQAISSRKADVRSDIYSLGCTWYHMLTGEPPFPDGAMTNKLAAHAKTAVPDPRLKNPKVPEPIVAILNRMTAKDPQQRYQTPAELLAELSHPGVTPKSLMDAWSEGDEGEAREARSSSGGDSDSEPARRGLPPRERRPQKPEKEERDYAKVFWTVMVLLFVALAGGVVMVVNRMGSSIDFSSSAPERSVRPKDLLEPEKKPDANVGPVTFAPASRQDTNSAAVIDASRHTERLTSPVQSSPGTSSPAAASKAITAFLPEWAGSSTDTSGLPTLTVQPGTAGGDAQFATLNDALGAVQAPGAVIQLVGRGPFSLHPIEVEDAGRILIESTETRPDAQPLIVALPGSQPSATLLNVKGTSLELRRVHLAVDDVSWNRGPPASLVRVTSGDLTVTQSSVTVLGTPGSLVSAFSVEGTMPASANRPVAGQVHVRLAQTVVRGNVSGLSLGAERSEGVIHNCLFSSGTSPAVRLPGPVEAHALSGRIVKIAASTLVSEQSGFWLGGNAQKPVRTSVALLDSAVARTGAAKEAALLRLENWDSQSAREALARLVSWDVQNTLLTGWTNAVASPTGFNIETLPEWSKLSSKSCRTEQSAFLSAAWPSAKIEVVKPELLAFNTATLPRDVKATDGTAPGTPLRPLSVVSLEGLDLARPLAGRVPLPPLFSALPASAGNALVIDSSREDVGKVLSARPLVNGLEVVIRGSGSRTSSPITIANAWIRIRFDQSQGPFTLAPRSASTPKDGHDDAFLTVINGGVELVGVNLVSGTESRVLPRWMIQINNGDLSLKNCRIQGPMIGTTRMKGVVQWLRPEPMRAERPFRVSREGYLAVVDSFLSGSGLLIEADLRKRALYLRNSVLAARDDLLTINLAGTDPVLAGTVDIEQCTLSATESLFHVLPAGLTGPAQKPVEIFVDRCVFAPPMRMGSQRPKPTLLVTTPAALEQNQVSWWERRTGYAPDVTTYLRDPTATAADQKFETAWLDRWGAGSVQKPLVGPGGVILKSELPEDRTRLEPVHFVLDKTAKAATWDDGRPIGADIPAMKLPELNKPEKPDPPQTPAKKKPAQKPGF